MDKTDDKIIRNTPKRLTFNNNEDTTNSAGDSLPLSPNTLPLRADNIPTPADADNIPTPADADNIPTPADADNIPTPADADNIPTPADADYIPNETSPDQSFTTSDSSVQQQNHTPISNEDESYRIHLGTQPGYYKEGRITFNKSQELHSKVIERLKPFLDYNSVNYTVIKEDAFSYSRWGLEPYACIKLSCANTTARGLAAIIGVTLRQDAIGIFTNNNDDDSHPVFTVSKSDGSSFTEDNALILMKKITKDCTCLSAQFDENGRNIEFHDYENASGESITIEHIENIICGHYETKDLFQVTKSCANSCLLQEEGYQNAIEQANFHSYSALIELTRLYDDLYDKPESAQGKINLYSNIGA